MCRFLLVPPVNIHCGDFPLTDLFQHVCAAEYTPLSLWIYVTASLNSTLLDPESETVSDGTRVFHGQAKSKHLLQGDVGPNQDLVSS